MESEFNKRSIYAGEALKEQHTMQDETAAKAGAQKDKPDETDADTIKEMIRSETQDGVTYKEEEKKQAYNAYIKEMSPAKSLPVQMLKAFLCGGIICTLGQIILNTAQSMGVGKELAGAWSSLLLVALSVILTGLSLYQIIADWGGAGALVPITGFANSVASPAIEYKPEGQVYGIGVKIFTIAGPVILYGIFTSWCLGLIYYFTGFQGLF